MGMGMWIGWYVGMGMWIGWYVSMGMWFEDITVFGYRYDLIHF